MARSMPSDTEHLSTETLRYGAESLARAAAIIERGGIVAVPTETVYGLAANARDTDAVAKVFAAKGRPGFNPLIVHVAGMEMAEALAIVDPVARTLMDRFWPGPLTIVLPARADAGLSPLVQAGLRTVALRSPAHRAMRALIETTGTPIAAPSANRSGAISPTRAEHVLESLGGRIPMILDDGPTERGLESTVVATGGAALRLLRPGPVTAAELERATGLTVETVADGGAIEAPGQLASHYAPSKPLRLNAVTREEGEYWLGFGSTAGNLNLSSAGDPDEAASNLFAALHLADAAAGNAIAVAPIPPGGIGDAINDRLRRAAAPRPQQSS